MGPRRILAFRLTFALTASVAALSEHFVAMRSFAALHAH